MQIIIKRTFLVVVDPEEETSTPCARAARRRARTLDVASSSSSSPSKSSTSALDYGKFDTAGARDPRVGAEDAGAESPFATAATLRGRIREAARCPRTHVVLEALLHRLPTGFAVVVAEELLGEAQRVACHIHGHSVLCRLLEFSAQHDPTTMRLVDELLAGDVATLCCHKIGHRVAMSIVSNGLGRQRAQVLAALTSHVARFARQRFAAQVLKEALLLCSAEECGALLVQLLRDPGEVTSLACHCTGTYVLQEVVMCVPAAAPGLLGVLRQAARRLRRDRYGSRLMREVGLTDDVETPALARGVACC